MYANAESVFNSYPDDNQYLSCILVMNHPQITFSWLTEWKLYDRNGNLDSYKQVGEQWVIESLKKKKSG